MTCAFLVPSLRTTLALAVAALELLVLRGIDEVHHRLREDTSTPSHSVVLVQPAKFGRETSQCVTLSSRAPSPRRASRGRDWVSRASAISGSYVTAPSCEHHLAFALRGVRITLVPRLAARPPVAMQRVEEVDEEEVRAVLVERERERPRRLEEAELLEGEERVRVAYRGPNICCRERTVAGSASRRRCR